MANLPAEPNEKAFLMTIVILISIIGVLSFFVLYECSQPFIIDNLSLSYLRKIKPEDRGLNIENVTGFTNGSVFLSLKNEGNYFVVIQDVILKDQWGYELEIKRSINEEIVSKSSDVFLVWFSEKLEIGTTYRLEVFTQGESYIGDVDMNTTFTIEK